MKVAIVLIPDQGEPETIVMSEDVEYSARYEIAERCASNGNVEDFQHTGRASLTLRWTNPEARAKFAAAQKKGEYTIKPNQLAELP